MGSAGKKEMSAMGTGTFRVSAVMIATGIVSQTIAIRYGIART